MMETCCLLLPATGILKICWMAPRKIFSFLSSYELVRSISFFIFDLMNSYGQFLFSSFILWTRKINFFLHLWSYELTWRFRCSLTGSPEVKGAQLCSPVVHFSSTMAAPSMGLDPPISKVVNDPMFPSTWIGFNLDFVWSSLCNWTGSLYEQVGPAEVSILPDNTWDGCGDKKR